MHAASVHPEPGSNSRKIYIISQVALSYNLSSYFILASFTLLSIYNSFKTRFALAFCFVLISCCSIFNDRFAVPLGDDFDSIPQRSTVVNTFLKSFLKNFFIFLRSLRGFDRHKNRWWASRDSNPGPTGYEPVALTN